MAVTVQLCQLGSSEEWRYWDMAQHFSDEEVIGNMLSYGTLFVGIFTPHTLDALLE